MIFLLTNWMIFSCLCHTKKSRGTRFIYYFLNTFLRSFWPFQFPIPLCFAGADDVITLRGESPSDGLFLSTDSSLVEKFNLSHALATREVTFDVIFFTTFVSYDKSFLHKYLSPGGRIIDTCEMPLLSDDLGFLGRCFLSCFVALRRFAGWVIRSPPDWGGPHLCHLTLDRLAGYVNEGLLQTVVDQVFTPEDAQRAIEHICSEKAIGSTIVTFRDSK